MELRQLRYFVSVIELGSLGRAAKELGVVTSALSQQLSRLESELSTRLLHRSAAGTRATDAGMAFYKQAQLTLRHADDAVRAAQQARLSGHVSLGLASSTAAMLAMPLITAMRERYPDVRLRLVESLSGNLTAMLNARQLDMAVLFDPGSAQRWTLLPLLEERLFFIGSAELPGLQALHGRARLAVADIAGLPLVLPSRPHGLRAAVDSAFARARCEPRVVLEVDGLAVLMDAVRAGIAATVQPGAATARLPQDALVRIEIADDQARRLNTLASLGDDELSPAALATRIVLRDVAAATISAGLWPGATLHAS
ncbi:MAG TPA: LysR substrate-binding domain-containing protein [Ideonella sp.]|uniref:LysR substrate-binding domain-containing protein n=1 Tax=Ideonella sp. TaxID=1929293 RepID=UPI002BD44CF6|nr:LysR substrate-binding domain-containing protein [Ideonella sp.]HSI47111.1 LysR substrate-binding domain-containing protein [Ideonella sp.]